MRLRRWKSRYCTEGTVHDFFQCGVLFAEMQSPDSLDMSSRLCEKMDDFVAQRNSDLFAMQQYFSSEGVLCYLPIVLRSWFKRGLDPAYIRIDFHSQSDQCQISPAASA